MEFKLDIDRLSQNELQYELQIRGVTDLADANVRRKTLRNLMKLEKLNSSFKLPAYPYTFDEDHEAVKKTLTEIDELIQEFDGNKSSGSHKKISSKIAHCYERITRMPASSSEEEQTRSKLLIRIMNSWSNVSIKSETNAKSSTPKHPGILDFQSLHIADESLDEDNLESTGTEDTCADLSPMQVKPKTILPAHWNLKFTGDIKDMSLGSFLERVDELCIARNVTRVQLFNSAIDLFQGKALIWYRANKSQFSCWNELVTQLREVFLPYNFDERLFDEIKSRCQGPDETIDIYIAIMETMFSRLNTTVSKETKLRILLRNLHPKLQTQLSLVDVESIEQLIKLGRRLEQKFETMDGYIAPSANRSKRSVEPALCYVASESEADKSQRKSDSSSSVNVSVPPRKSRNNKLTCFNCGSSDHLVRDCDQTFVKKCYGCGTPNVTKTTCQKCNSSGKANRR